MNEIEEKLEKEGFYQSISFNKEVVLIKKLEHDNPMQAVFISIFLNSTRNRIRILYRNEIQGMSLLYTGIYPGNEIFFQLLKLNFDI